jgi:hypothetical protein
VIRFWEILFLLEVIGITRVHANMFYNNIKIGNLFHAFWTVVYCIPLAILFFVYHYYWWLILAAAGVRFVFYNPILNGWRKMKFFYIHHEDNGSWWDDIELKFGKAYPYLWAVGVILFGVLQLNRFL